MMDEAEQAGESVPEGLRQLAELGAEQLNTLSAGVEDTRKQLEGLGQEVERISKGFAAFSSAVAASSDFYDVVLAVNKALGYDVELTEEARRSRERLAATQELLNYITQTYGMVQQALQLQLLGAGDASKLLLNTVAGLADAMRDGVITNEEFREILSKLGVDAGNVAGSLHGLLISSLEAMRRSLEGNVAGVEELISSLNRLDGMVAAYTIVERRVRSVASARELLGRRLTPAEEAALRRGSAMEELIRRYGGAVLQHGAWEIPRDMLALLHRGEMVLPRPVAEQVRSGRAAKVVNISIAMNINGAVYGGWPELAEHVSREIYRRARWLV